MNEEISVQIEKFKNRELKAKEIFYIQEISKPVSYDFIKQYHYLGDAKFFSMYQFGLFMIKTKELVGCATYSLPQGTCSLKGWFGIEDNGCKEVVELSRLCLHPTLNGTNATSYLLSNSMKMLKPYGVRAIITLADSSRHIGSIYQVCNFKYYGLTSPAKDFYAPDAGNNHRVKMKGMDGVYLDRSRKHRYAFILDPTLTCLYKEQPRPTTKGETLEVNCCKGKLIVHDDRFDKYYTCPKCTSKLVNLDIDEVNHINELFLHNDYDFVHNYVEDLIKEKTKPDFDMVDLWGE